MMQRVKAEDQADRLMRTADILLGIQRAATVEKVSAVLTDFR